MDCLFHDDEQRALEYYIEELHSKKINPIIYAAPDYDFFKTGIMAISNTPESIPEPKGYVGRYTGIPIYVCDGLDSHTCIVVPDFNMIPF